MKTLSIDCATKSMGVCALNITPRKILIQMINTCMEAIEVSLLAATSIKKEISILRKAVQAIDKIVNLLWTIEYLNVIDLVPGQKLDETDSYLRSRRLTGALNYITSTVDMSEIQFILLEFQMGPNHKSSEIYSKLEQYFSQTDPDEGFSLLCGKGKGKGKGKGEGKKVNHSVTCMVEGESKRVKGVKGVKIERVGPSLKNTVSFASHLKHKVFLAKYMDPYTANKNHCKENLLYYLRISGNMGLIEGLPKKNIDDAADAFMQAIAWVRKHHSEQYF